MDDDPTGQDGEQRPESLLPYEEWTEQALRQVMVRALQYAAVNGLPGGHHFYLTFRTDHPRVAIPARLKAQYPQEMTIVLQHQFWDLAVDEPDGLMTVGLSFGGVPATLRIPLAAITAFADPEVRFGLRFHATELPEPEPAAPAEPQAEAAPEAAPEEPPATPQVVSLDAFRRRTPPKES
ncbi:conserved protein of unknown function [Rhodovastum atsumiense]|uniref:Stringent starvation protein B n=1 Tax=Rhodovastum atsumiense TaxID=504468 RepID=A0A5M6INC5_9PROT|nr:ClpXP protease specificity-enhancing factor SspB [Rhodovastum atsumiense]KAA5609762.1 hypothetical protein F1189_22470 [Rhodovastum atsumiense]CAH2599461.1 conserved protein of unknown function [Rhodovastum atsumiense]